MLSKDTIKRLENNDTTNTIKGMLDHIYKKAEIAVQEFSPSSYSDETKRHAFNYVFMAEVLAKITEVSILHDNTTATILLAATMLKY